MINISKLYCGQATASDKLRYGEGEKDLQSAKFRKPVVVWNITRTCNLKCIHCYSSSENKKYSGELTFVEAKNVIDDLAQFKVPSILFSGGEPLMRPDIFELANYARKKGLSITLSTNGTLITKQIARKIKDTEFNYVGISLDGIGEVNDRFRGTTGAFEKTCIAFRNCKEVGQKVGLRLTLTRHNFLEIEKIFDFVKKEEIERVCFYHLAYSGRARELKNDTLTPQETKQAIDLIAQKAMEFYKKGIKKEILTVGCSVDGVYIYLKLLEEGRYDMAENTLKLLQWNGGALYSSGVSIGCIDFYGNVHPDQFWQEITLGNVKKQPFSKIWTESTEANNILSMLRNKKKYLKGKCKDCKYLDLCGGGLRSRAHYFYGDPWQTDPACYLT